MSQEVRAAVWRVSRHRWVKRVAGVVVPVVFATLAVMHPGMPVSQVDLNDGTVWLTNQAAHRVGRYNPVVEELNAGLATEADDFDVLQDGQDVLLVEAGRIAVIDPVNVALGAQAGVPAGALVSMAAGTTIVTLPSEGKVWARTTALVGSLVTDQDPPDLELGEGGAAVVARSGRVLGAQQDGTIRHLTVGDGAAGVAVTEAGKLDGDLSGPIDQVTAVGDEIVVLAGTMLHTASGSVDLSSFGSALTLQQAGPSADTVLVATRGSLLRVPLGGGDVEQEKTGGDAVPAAPVLVGACAHGAWASAARNYMRLCGDDDPETASMEAISSTDELVFRVNRDVVVLNSVGDGRLWMPEADTNVREPNWEDIEEENTEETETDQQTTVTTQTVQPECTPQSAPPTAADDDYGVRPGQTLILSPIDNDASSSCGILSISESDSIPEAFGSLTPVYGGRSLQLVVSPTARGTTSFMYTVTDGRGSVAPSTATVTLTVRDDDENGAPVQMRVGSMLVEQGGTATYDLLGDFRDPDGDQMVLIGAAAQGGGTVRARGDGQVRFQSDGSTLGRQTVEVVVSDGTGTTEGTLYVDVRPAGSLPPVIDPVHVVTYVDDPVEVRPLDRVRTASREPARLASVEEVPGLVIEQDLDGGVFTVTGRTPGTYYVPFVVTASPQQASGLARVDVLARPDAIPPPVAVLDVALLPPGGEVTIDPLENDIDSSGGVLVVQSVDVPAESGLRVAILDHQLLRISATRTLEVAVSIGYTISSGTASATGQVVVQPVPAPASQQAPVVPSVHASVRTGGVVTIPVLADAYDPDGDTLTLAPDLAEAPAQGQGLMFVSGDVLRYQAPATAGEVHATFTVVDSAGNATAATVTVNVHASDPESKPLPTPVDLTARVFASESVRIPVPLAGIDIDGDGVSLLGVDRAPAKGRITEVGADWLVYEALPGELGTDTFTYAVEDWAGQRAVATVQVGIAPRPTAAVQVVCRDDKVSVRPGRTIEVRVLANDVDTGGGELTLSADLRFTGAIDATVDGRRIVVRAPSTDGVLQIAYTAQNDRGGSDSGVLTVTVSGTAPILAPIARDVVIPATATINKKSVEVDVLGVAQNPSGPLSDLAVSVDPSAADAATVTNDKMVVVTLAETAQTIPYILTNIDPDAAGVSSYAFITVPALGDFPPMRRPNASDLEVITGEPLEIRLPEQVQVAPGRTAQIGDVATVSATKADGSELVVDEQTLRFVAEPGYAGPASVSVLVSDGPIGDTTTHTAMMTFTITVVAAEERPPTFTPSVLDLPQGETTSVDLAVFTSAPVTSTAGGSRYEYELNSALPDGFSATLSGSILTVEAEPSVARGTVAGIALAIKYGANGVLSTQVDLRVVASARPLARVQAFTVSDGVEGGVSSVSVLEGAFNPFPDTPLTVQDPVVETPGAGTASGTGSQVDVRPAEGFIGPMVVRFTVSDATGDADRMIEGRVTVVVRGRPDVPTAPRVQEVRDRTVVLAWDAPVNNGEPITAYRVTSTNGAVAADCASTTCTIEGLTNNVEYSFTVTARNAVGWSDPSPASSPARPDARPLAPAVPGLVWGQGSVTATWSEPGNPGSPITKYEVEISPAAPRGATQTTSSKSIVFDGLTNGQGYRVRVRATNSAPEPGDWSAWSETQVPAAPPGAPVNVSATNSAVKRTDDGIMTVTWNPGATNGDAISGYQVQVDDSVVATLGAGVGTYQFAAQFGTKYNIAVRAQNKAGWSSWASTSGMVWSAPDVPTGLGARDADPGSRPYGNGQVVLTWAAPADTGGSGVRITQYEIEGVGTFAGTSTTVSNLPGGQSLVYRIRAWNSQGAVSEWAVFPTTSATTAPAAPNVHFDTSVVGQVTVGWDLSNNGGTNDGLAYRYRLNGGSWVEVGAEASRAFTASSGSSLSIEVQAYNVRGWSSSTSDQVRVS